MVSLFTLDFTRLTNSDLVAIAVEISGDATARVSYIDRLVSDLQSYGLNESAEESLYILGLRHFNSFPPTILREINEQVRARVKAPISSYFLSGSLEEPNITAKSIGTAILSPPEYSEKARRLKNTFVQKLTTADWHSELDDFILFHRSFAERTGDAELLVLSFGAIAYEILKGNFRTREAARAVERLVLEGLRWEPENVYFWSFWAQANISVGQFDDAESIFWEALHRHPHNIVGRHIFAEFLAVFLNRVDDAIVILRGGLAAYPNHHITINLLAKYLLSKSSLGSSIEAWELLVSVPKESADAYTRNLMAQAALKLHQAPHDRSQFGELVGGFTKDTEELGGLGFTLARLPGGNNAAVSLLEIAVKRFPDNVKLRNRLARVLAATMDPAGLDAAIRLLSETLHLKDNEYTRNQLAQCLIAKGDETEAINLLGETEGLFGATKFTKQLRELAAAQNSKQLAQLLRVPGSRFVADKPDEILTKRGAVIDASLKNPLPSFVVKWGNLRKLRFMIESGSGPQSDDARQQIQYILTTDPTFAYARLLAERHNLWIKASAKPGIFVTAFEKALRAGNIEQMAAVGKRYPRWALLAVVAGALIGDEDSAAQVKKLLSVEAPSMVPAIEVVRNAVGPLVAGTNDSNEIVTCLAKYRSRLFPVLYDASEATVSEFSLVA